jgi:hypothetical protein
VQQFFHHLQLVLQVIHVLLSGCFLLLSFSRGLRLHGFDHHKVSDVGAVMELGLPLDELQLLDVGLSVPLDRHAWLLLLLKRFEVQVLHHLMLFPT